MDKRKILVCIIILLIILIVSILIALNSINTKVKKEDNNDNINAVNNSILNNITDELTVNSSNEVSQTDNVVLNTTDYADVKIKSVYYAIKNIINDFFETANFAFNEKDAEQFYGKEFYLNEMHTQQEKLYSILGNEYINKESITKQNLQSKLNQYASSTFKVERIIEKIKENNICIFIVYGTMNQNTTYSMAVITDESNLRYEVFPYEYLRKYNINNLKISKIEENSYNRLEYKDISEEKVIKDYFSDYKYDMQTSIETAYNKLNSEYKTKRFRNINSYQEYINANIDIIRNSFLKSYKITNDGDYTIYDCIDNYNYHYIFKEKSIMQYEVLLDNYTIMLNEDIQYYNTLDKFDKSKYNLTKFINMVNTKDYNGIYNILDNTFKNNNFKTEESLKQYIQKNMYELNAIEIKDEDDKTYEYYVFNCKITNLRNNQESKNMTIIINQSERTEFTMSFSFK